MQDIHYQGEVEKAQVCVWLSRLSESTLAEQKGWGGAVVVKY